MSLDNFIAICWPLKHPKITLQKCSIEADHICLYVALMCCLAYYSNNIADIDEFCEGWPKVPKDRQQANSVMNTTGTLLKIIGQVFLAICVKYCYIAWIGFKASKSKRYFQRYIRSSSEKSSAQRKIKQMKGIETTILLLSLVISLWSPIGVHSVLLLAKRSVLEKIKISCKL